MPDTDQPIAGYNGLTHVEPTLPTHFYLDEDHYEQELRQIWYRNWLYVCRASDLVGPRAFRVFEIGSQQILILRDEENELRAFHNTCRHRGSILAQESQGRFRSSMIICPYHAWGYDLCGNLKKTPTRHPQPDFHKEDYSLYGVGIRDWNGFIFIHLDEANAQPLEDSFNDANVLNHWDLSELQIGHSHHKQLDCNWKVFWENFNECLHCPNIHPELSRIVPLYKQYFMEVNDDPKWEEHQKSGDLLYKAGLSQGNETWSTTGEACTEYFPNLTQEEIKNGHTYCETLPSAFIVGHVDYVRVLRVLPIGPERTDIFTQWLFRKETLEDASFSANAVTEFGEKVIEQDGFVAELNQKGLHSIRHKQGTLMAEEYSVHDFHQWVKRQLD
ncbi:MAG: ring-hydroxylating oxygenase subunit alpha [Deltaproteobacteria bacterium]|nr:ring-hydroxylating oxygenase subunit alpha [Deltaproteobacteria bacterium]